MSQVLTKAAERIATLALAAAIESGTLEVLDGDKKILVKFSMPSGFLYDAAESRISFNAPAESTVQKIGKPNSFRVRSKDGEVLMEGTAGRDGDLPIPADKLFEGMQVTLGGIDYQLKFKQ